MKEKKLKKIKKIGDFYVIKINSANNTINGFYFDKKFEKFMKIKDRQVYLWFAIFVTLESLFRNYIFEIVLCLLILILLFNLMFYIYFGTKEKRVELQLNSNDFKDIILKKHRAWQKTMTMTLVFVCITRLIIYIQPELLNSFKMITVYSICFLLSLFSISFWIYYGRLKNEYKQKKIKPIGRKKRMS